MWYQATVQPPAPSEPLTISEVKRRLRIDFADDDDDLALLIAAARDHVEKYCGLVLPPQDIEIKCDTWADFSRLPIAPVTAVTALTYVATDGSTATFSDFELRAEGLEASIVPAYGAQWPSIRPGSRISVTASAGFEEIPAAIKHAMLLFVGDAYEARENSKVENWTAFDALLCNYRR